MKKRIIPVMLLTGGMMLLLGGCYEPLPITEKEMDMVAEYAAGVLVKYGTDSEEILLNLREQQQAALLTVTPTVKPTKEPTKSPDPTAFPSITPGKNPEDEKKPSVTPAPDYSEATMEALTKLLAKEGFSFRYLGFEVGQLYQGEGEMFAAAAEGKKLIVLEFSITNTSSSAKKLTMNRGAARDYIFTLRAGSSSVKPTLTLLREDLYTSYDVSYQAGETKKGVLVFECPEKTDTTTMNLAVLKENDGKDDSVIIKIN